ncbi:hypothetical protein [Parabacteroides goldsteinii]|uniref:hypothetical protein n=1 Tax=Parabacteroides goldsteinii TaxID=328812 RepID=UPI0026774449|nr:hypothetical protein [Parabacteroides goldsteinii]
MRLICFESYECIWWVRVDESTRPFVWNLCLDALLALSSATLTNVCLMFSDFEDDVLDSFLIGVCSERFDSSGYVKLPGDGMIFTVSPSPILDMVTM